jgi:heptosyltransferase-2
MKLAIFLPNWVGDLVMATPTLRALRHHFGGSTEIVGILRPHLADVLAGTEWLDEYWYFEPGSAHRDWDRLGLVRRMRRARPEMALLLTNSLGTALWAWLGGARQRIGYVRDARGPLLTGKLYPLREAGRPRPLPMVEYYLALARAVGCPPESPRLELALTQAEQDKGERSDGRVVALNSSGAYGAAKLWPIEHCGTLARQIVEQLDHDVLVLCGPREHAAAREVVQRAACPRVFALPAEEISLSASKACLARSRLLVSTDSGPRHMAAALGKPVITLLGPTLPAWIENPTVSGSILRTELDCLGCGKRTCPLRHHRCMRDLLPERVLAEVARFVEGSMAKVA